MLTDPIADMLTRVRNANTAMHDRVSMPSSKQKIALAKLLESEGYISSFEVAPAASGPGDVLTITMKIARSQASGASQPLVCGCTARPMPCHACSAVSGLPSCPRATV